MKRALLSSLVAAVIGTALPVEARAEANAKWETVVSLKTDQNIKISMDGGGSSRMRCLPLTYRWTRKDKTTNTNEIGVGQVRYVTAAKIQVKERLPCSDRFQAIPVVPRP